MADPVEVLQQAARLRTGTRFERARAGATALSTFLQLSTDDKRELAVLVAQRVAPELVPRIQAEAGIDLTQEQSRAVLDMIARLDGNDLEELTSSLATEEGRRATIGAVTASAAAATGLDDVVAPGPGRAPTAVAGAPDGTAGRRRDADADAAEVAILAGRVADLEARLAAAETTARTAEASLATTREAAAAADARIHELEAELRDRQSAADVRRRDHEAELHDLRRQLRRATREADQATSDSTSSPASSAPTPVVARPVSRSQSAFASLPDFGAPFALDPVPDLPAAAAGRHDDLVARLDGADSGTALRLVTAWLPRLTTTTAPDRLRILQAIPQGWGRRRALQRMVEAGVAGDEDVAALELLARTGDQVFAATSLLAAGVSRDQVMAHVSPAAQRRLARRAA